MTTSEIATVLAWIDALNDRDLDTLDKLSSGDIEIETRTGPPRAECLAGLGNRPR